MFDEDLFKLDTSVVPSSIRYDVKNKVLLLLFLFLIVLSLDVLCIVLCTTTVLTVNFIDLRWLKPVSLSYDFEGSL